MAQMDFFFDEYHMTFLYIRPSDKDLELKILLIFQQKTYVVGAQKNRLNETVLFSTQNICLN